MHLHRRNFLGLCTAALAAGVLGVSSRGRAAPGPAKNLLVIFARGGWDVTYTFDAKPGSASVDNAVGTWTDYPAGDLQVYTDPSRQPLADFFAAHADRAAIVNGIWVGSVSHLVCTQYMLTGSRLPGRPDLGAMTASQLGADLPVPYMDIGGGALAGDQAAILGRLGARSQLVTLLDPSADAYFPGAVEGYTQSPMFAPDAAQRDAIRGYVEARAQASRASARGALGDNARQLDAYLDALTNAEALRNNAALGSLTLGGKDNSLSAQAAIALDLFASATSRAVFLDSLLAWDSHDDISEQDDNYNTFFTELLAVADAIEAAGQVESTLVVVLSEMSRTPKLNANGGKDHWPITSALLLGGGVTPGIYGATDDALGVVPVDFATGASDPSGQTLGYDSFIAGLLQHLGAGPDLWLPNAAPFAPYSG